MLLQLGTATSNKTITITPNVKQDFYAAFATNLTRYWRVTSITCEITINQTSNYDHIGLLIGEVSLYGNYTNKITGDINWDGIVDAKDMSLVIQAYQSYPGHPKWNPNADINGDRKVDAKDVALVIKYYGKVD